jgi:class 3 adenylate cyclase
LLASADHSAKTLQLTQLQNRLRLLALKAEATEPNVTASVDSAKPFTTPKRPEQVAATRELREENSPRDLVSDATHLTAEPAITWLRDLGAEGSLGQTVTILISDIEDSAKLFDSLGDLRAQEIIHQHNEIIREQVRSHGGKEIKTMGDSFMVAFSSARRAVLCAISIQNAFSRYQVEHIDRESEYE